MPLGMNEELTTWLVTPLTDLIRHIVGTRHQECRVDMARLESLLALLAMEPGPSHLSLAEIRDLAAQFCVELRTHLAREERDLFPVLLALEQGMAPGIGKAQLGLLRSLLVEDHVKETRLLSDILIFARALATDLPPDSPQGRIHAAVVALAARFEGHVGLENQVLFPRMCQPDRALQ